MRPLNLPVSAGSVPGLGGKMEISRVNPGISELLLGAYFATEGLGVGAVRVQFALGWALIRALRSRSGSVGRDASRTAARYPPMKMEYMTASAQPTPKVKPRKKPMIEPQ